MTCRPLPSVIPSRTDTRVCHEEWNHDSRRPGPDTVMWGRVSDLVDTPGVTKYTFSFFLSMYGLHFSFQIKSLLGGDTIVRV